MPPPPCSRTLSAGSWRTGLLAALGLLVACSLVDYRVRQCAHDSDCAFPDSCEQGLCLAAQACVVHSDCRPDAVTGGPAACVASRCEPLLSEGCSEWLPGEVSQLADDTMLLGAFAPLHDPERASVTNYRVALEEINEVGLHPEGRAIALVLCDSTDEPAEVVEEGLSHLVSLGVPGLIAGLSNMSRVRDLFSHQRDTAGLFFLAPAESGGFTVANDLLWYLGGEPGQYAPAYGALLTQLRGRDPDALEVRVLLSEDEYDRSLWTAVRDDWPQVAGPEPGVVALDDTSRAVAAVAAHEPDVLLVMTDGDFYPFFSGLQASVEPERWPLFVLSPRMSSDPALERYAPARPGRFVSIGWATPRSPVAEAYHARMQRLELGDLLRENSYDALYYLAYAAAAAKPRGGELTGADLGRGFHRIAQMIDDSRQRPSVEVGPEQVAQVAARLSGKEPEFLLHGTLGEARFDAVSGARVVTTSLGCYEPSGDALVFRSDVAYLDPATGEFEAVEEFCVPGVLP